MSPYIHLILPSYGVMAFIGGLLALLYTYFRIDRFQVLFTDYCKIFVIAVIGGYLGSKALFIATQIPQLVTNFSFSNLVNIIIHGGIVFYGGLFGVLLALKVYAKRSRYEESTIFGMIAPTIPLFHCFGRIGCFLAGCCYGRELGYTVELFQTVYIDRVPTQAFEAVFELIIFFVLIMVERKNNGWNLLKIYLISYAVFRFANEFFRGDEIRGNLLGLSTSQWVSLTIIGYYMIKRIRKRPIETLGTA